jgi:hypothetical protein
MSLHNDVIDAFNNGSLGNGVDFTRQELVSAFPNYSPNYTGCFLSNSEMRTGQHSPTYRHFTIRVRRGVYRIHPSALQERIPRDQPKM